MMKRAKRRTVACTRSVKDKPDAETVRTMETELRGYIERKCSQEGFPVRGWLDTVVKPCPHPRIYGERWLVTVEAVIDHVC